MTPYFSIITVTFNAAEVLEATIRSIRNQTFKDYEWIVIDGASSDATVSVARRNLMSADSLISEPDNGIYDAMNKGLRLAQGKFVNFLNAGDAYADADVLEAVHGASKDVDVIYGDSWLALPDGLTRYRRAGPIKRAIKRRMPFWHQSMFTDRETHLRHQFDTSFRISADYAVIASMFVAGARLRYLSRPLNINEICPTAASVRGLIRSAREDYRVRTEILGCPPLVERCRYLRKRTHIALVKGIRFLPDRLISSIIPKPLRRRLY